MLVPKYSNRYLVGTAELDTGRVLLEAFVSAAFLGSDFLPFLLIIFLGLAVILLLN